MIARYYREAYEARQEQENFNAWLNGLYVYKAFETVMANAFSPKGTPPVKYLDKPLDLFKKNEKQEEAEVEQQQIAIANMFTAWGKRFNANHTEEHIES